VTKMQSEGLAPERERTEDLIFDMLKGYWQSTRIRHLLNPKAIMVRKDLMQLLVDRNGNVLWDVLGIALESHDWGDAPDVFLAHGDVRYYNSTKERMQGLWPREMRGVWFNRYGEFFTSHENDPNARTATVNRYTIGTQQPAPCSENRGVAPRTKDRKPA